MILKLIQIQNWVKVRVKDPLLYYEAYFVSSYLLTNWHLMGDAVNITMTVFTYQAI